MSKAELAHSVVLPALAEEVLVVGAVLFVVVVLAELWVVLVAAVVQPALVVVVVPVAVVSTVMLGLVVGHVEIAVVTVVPLALVVVVLAATVLTEVLAELLGPDVTDEAVLGHACLVAAAVLVPPVEEPIDFAVGRRVAELFGQMLPKYGVSRAQQQRYAHKVERLVLVADVAHGLVPRVVVRVAVALLDGHCGRPRGWGAGALARLVLEVRAAPDLLEAQTLKILQPRTRIRNHRIRNMICELCASLC